MTLPPTRRELAGEGTERDVKAAGLRVDWRFGSYELHAPNDDYAVWVLSSTTP